METIQATVNRRLLNKADRLFTGTLDGRITEVLQNARRAGATRVEITNADGRVTVRDNGHGIEDFSKLLDLGGSGWDEATEVSEDRSGVGLFCLAPKEVTLRSNGKRVTIRGDGWTGAPVDVMGDDESVQGTVLEFQDEPWSLSTVTNTAVFSGMQVVVDGNDCPMLPFVSDNATHYPELGCKIEVSESDGQAAWYSSARRGQRDDSNATVNFHGLLTSFSFYAVNGRCLDYLVDMTGEPTGIRLMLPARMCLVENEALERLKAAMELEAYRYLQRKGRHRLPYEQYLKAKELGVDLPEAEPDYRVGAPLGIGLGRVPMFMPRGLSLAECYRFDPDIKEGLIDVTNISLLVISKGFDSHFVPVEIPKHYDGYSWAKLPTIDKVELDVGKVLHESLLWEGKLVCVDSLTIAAHTSDGRVFRSPAYMGVRANQDRSNGAWFDEEVLVTPESREEVPMIWIMNHLGSFLEEGGTGDEQEASFAKKFNRYWSELVGPDEHFRREVLSTLDGTQDWKAMAVFADGRIKLKFKDGSAKHIRPPKSAKVAR